jgi:hypothetical protein
MSRAANAAVEDTTVSGARPLSQAERPDLESMHKGSLLDLAEARGVIVDAAWTKRQIIHALETVEAAAKGFSGGVPKTTEESVPTITRVADAINQLLDTNKNAPPPGNTSWGCTAPASDVLKWMIERGLPGGLFTSSDELVAFLKAPANAKIIREAQILVSYPAWVGKTLIRLSRAESRDQYHRTDV